MDSISTVYMYRELRPFPPITANKPLEPNGFLVQRLTPGAGETTFVECYG